MERPSVKIISKPDGEFELEGFDLFDEWARQNVPAWSYFSNQCLLAKLPEVERLKFISAILLESVMSLEASQANGVIIDGRETLVKLMGKISSAGKVYNFGHTARTNEAFVSSHQSGAAFIIPWKELGRLAIQNGVDNPLPDKPKIIV